MFMIADVPRAWSPWMRAICLALTLGTVGCVGAKFNETYYVGVYKKHSDQPLQFYRFKMKGSADFGSKTKFESGWFDAAAIEKAVGENRTVKVIPPTMRRSSSTDNCVVVVGPEGEARALNGQRLAIFMATDPGPLTESISAFANSLDTQLSAQLIAMHQSRTAANVAAKEQRRLRAKTLLSTMKDFIPASAQNPELIKKVLDVLIGQLEPEASADDQMDSTPS